MKKLFITFLAFPAVLSAQTLKAELQCAPLESVVETLTKNHKEMIRWSGTSKRLEYLLFLNKESKSWSLGMTDGTLYCSLGEGVGFVEIENHKSTL